MNKKNTFKIGDKVRRINFRNGTRGLQVGHTATVTGHKVGGYVLTDHHKSMGNDPRNLELVESVPTFKVGDRVRFKGDKKSQEFRDQWFPNSSELVIKSIDRYGTTLFNGHNFCAGSDSLELATAEKVAPKVQPIKAVKVSQADACTALTAFVKDILGIDATVTKINSTYAKAVELTLAAE